MSDSMAIAENALSLHSLKEYRKWFFTRFRAEKEHSPLQLVTTLRNTLSMLGNMFYKFLDLHSLYPLHANKGFTACAHNDRNVEWRCNFFCHPQNVAPPTTLHPRPEMLLCVVATKRKYIFQITILKIGKGWLNNQLVWCCSLGLAKFQNY